MSIYRNMRDIAANLALAEALAELRHEQLAACRQGKVLSAETMSLREQELMNRLIQKYYGAEVAATFGLERDAETRRSDYGRRSTAIADQVTLETHRILVRLPIVGMDGRRAKK